MIGIFLKKLHIIYITINNRTKWEKIIILWTYSGKLNPTLLLYLNNMGDLLFYQRFLRCAPVYIYSYNIKEEV